MNSSQKERAQIFLDVEGALAQNSLNESNLTEEAKAFDVNHQIVEADKEYAEKTREHNDKRNSEVQHLSTKIRDSKTTSQLSKRSKSASTSSAQKEGSPTTRPNKLRT